MEVKLIDREASNKGPRLQKLRAINLIFDAIEKNPRAFVYVGLEYYEDVYLKYVDAVRNEEYFEQDKNYDCSSNFTFATHEVLNSLCSFLDIYIKKQLSKNLIFCFYSTNSISKERSAGKVKELSFELPDEPILKLLQERRYSHPNFLLAASQILTHEYTVQYSSIGGNGYTKIIANFSLKDWEAFFNTIVWKFEDEDEISLKSKLLSKVTRSPYYNNYLLNKEEAIIGLVGEKLEEKQGLADYSEKFLHPAELQLIFKELESVPIGNDQVIDPVWKEFIKLAPPLDSRNLADKIDSICKSYSKRKLGSLARKVGMSRVEFEEFKDKNDFLSLKYRIYICCHDKLMELIEKNTDVEITEATIEFWLSELKGYGKSEIEKLSTSYYYSKKSEPIIEGIILELIDSCFLSFNIVD